MIANTVKIERTFDAPLQAVWQCWTTPELLSIWYGANVETIIHYFDFSEGGYWQEEMRTANGSMHGRSEIVEIIPGRKIVLRQSTVDEHGNIIENPMMPDWPETVEATIMFVENGDITEMMFTWEPHEASDKEIETFNKVAPELAKGWEKGFDMMEREAKAIAD